MKQKRKGHSKINNQIKKYLYNWTTHHPQVIQSPIVNYCLEVKIDGYTEPQMVPKLLLQVSVRELHNNIVITTKYGGLKEERDEDDDIIISDSTLLSVLPSQLKNVIKIQGHGWLQMLHIFQKYTFIITVMMRSLF